MSKRGPKTKITHEMRVAELKNHNIFYDTGKVKKESDPIWIIICNNLNQSDPLRSLTVRNIQTYVAQNRNNVILDIKATLTDSSSNVKPQDQEDNLKFDVEEQLLRIKNDALYKSTVREFCTYPFVLFYWSFEALNLASLFNDKMFVFGVIGSLSQPFTAPDKSCSKMIFQFTLGIDVLNEYIPICEFLSEENSISLVTRFLHECLRSNLKIPRNININYYWNHIISINFVFNMNMTLEHYLLKCYNYLIHENQELPRCIITTDVRMLILKVKNWDCVCSIRLHLVKQFYLCCIIVLSVQQTLADFRDILKKIFIIVYSTYQNENTDDAINYILSEMKDNEIFLNYNIEYIEELGSENDYKEFVNLEVNRNVDYNSCQKIINFITNIFVEAKSYVTRDMGHELNAYCNNEFCKNLIELCIQFPLWTKVMIEGQKTESINILKSYRHTFEQHLSNSCNDSPPTLDIFLLRSIEYDNEKVQFARNSVKENAIKETKNNLENTYLYHEENWMGLNPDESSLEESSDSDVSDDFEKDTFSDNIDLFVEIPHNDSTISEIVESFCEKVKDETFYETADKSMEIEDTLSMKNENEDFRSNAETVLKTTTSTPKQRGKFLRPCPEIDLIHQKPVKDTKKQKSQSKRQIKDRKIIQNANMYPPRKVNKKPVILITSSYFDSIMEVLTTAYSLIKKFQDFVNDPKVSIKEPKAELLSLLQNYAMNFNVTPLYNGRANLISKVCNSDDVKFTWTKSVGEFYEEIMFPNILTNFFCTMCNEDVYMHSNIVKISYEDLLSPDLSSIISESSIICGNCGKNANSINIQINYLLCLDVEDSVHKPFNLGDINTSLSFGEQTLILIGVIGFKETLSTENLRHYIAYTRNFNGSWLKYDSIQISKRISRLQKNEFNTKVALVIYAEYEI